MNIYRYLAALLVAPALTLTQPFLALCSEPSLHRKLAMYTKPAVVRIVSRCYGEYRWYYEGKKKNGPQSYIPVDIDAGFIGTGFLIMPNGYIVTSARVIESDEDCKKRLKANIIDTIKNQYKYIDARYKPKELVHIGDKENEKGEFTFDPKSPNYYENKVYLPKAGINPLPFDVKKSGRKSGARNIKASQDVAIIKVPLENAPTLKLGDSAQVEIQDSLITVGYPKGADINFSQNEQHLTEESFYEASVLEGRISNPNKQLEGGYPVLLIDIQAQQGSGGSPLINNRGEVIGMLASKGYDKNPTIPLAIPTSTIEEFIRQSGATNKGGVTDEYYRDGLRLYWKENYKEAKAKFLKVKGLFKNHSEVERLISEIDQIEADWWAKPWTDPKNLLMMGLVVGGSVVAAVAYFLLKRKTNLVQAFAGSPGLPNQGESVFSPPFQSNGNGVSQHSFLELEYQGQIRRLELHNDEHRLGRDSAWSDFDIPNSWEVISRHHAILRKEGENYRIYDGDGAVPSRNGLWIDNDICVDLKDGYPLVNGDKLKIGKNVHEQITLTYYNPNSKQESFKTTKMAN